MNIYDYILSLPVEGDNQQVDALTITATGLSGKIAIGMVIEDAKDYLDNEQKKPFRFGGAQGWARGSIRYAEKVQEDIGRLWAILMVTGPQSEHAFKVACQLDDLKFTRCDCAVDVFLYEKVMGLPRLIKDNYKGKAKVVLFESELGDTIYIGSRQSDAYLRIYDKSKQYGLDLGRVYRWEVEYKGELAKPVVDKVRDGGRMAIRELVFGEAHHKSVPSPIVEGQRGVKREKISISSPDAKIAWLARQVAPTVKWLNSLGYQDEVVKALNLRLPGFDK